MSTPSSITPRLSTAQVVGQVALTVVVLAALVPGVMLSLLLLVLACDDGCSGDQAESFRYTAQALLMAVVVAVTLAALALGFTRRRQAFWSTLGAAATLAAVWVTWVVGSGSF